jgi:hypothetical protein
MTMTCPPDVAEVLLAILGQGVLQARTFGWSGDTVRAAVEADHVHNLPGLIANFTPEQLDYYWTTERPGYLRHSGPAQVAPFQPLWERLRPHVGAVQAAEREETDEESGPV